MLRKNIAMSIDAYHDIYMRDQSLHFPKTLYGTLTSRSMRLQINLANGFSSSNDRDIVEKC